MTYQERFWKIFQDTSCDKATRRRKIRELFDEIMADYRECIFKIETCFPKDVEAAKKTAGYIEVEIIPVVQNITNHYSHLLDK